MLTAATTGFSLAWAGAGALLAALGCTLFSDGEKKRSLPPGVSRTAFGTLAYRAVAAQDPDQATRNPDHLAARLCDQTMLSERMGLSLDFAQAIAEIERSGRHLFYYVNARTRYMDEVLTRALERGASQVVVLGAGLDTRAHRFSAGHPGVAFFEVDMPMMSAVKQKMVAMRLGQSPPALRYVTVDFSAQRLDEELARAGFESETPAIFIWEGVTMYLEAGAVADTLGRVAGCSAPGSLIAFDHGGAWATDGGGGATAERLAKLGEPVKWGISPEDLGPFLAGQGLTLIESMGSEEMVARYLTGSDGEVRGRIPDSLWFALAQVSGA